MGNQFFKAYDFPGESAIPFCGPEPISYAGTPAKPVHKCPACLKPWLDENAKFQACRHCPYRIQPTPQM